MDTSTTMDASTIFNQLINKIENSKLNYVINKTQFSANISIKRSFIKYFDASLQTAAAEKQDTNDLRNLKLAEKIATPQQEEKDNLEETLEKEQMKVKSLSVKLDSLERNF